MNEWPDERQASAGQVQRPVRPLDPERDPVDYAEWLADKLHAGGDTCKEAASALVRMAREVERLRVGIPKERLALNVRHRDCHKAADAFWAYWKEYGETHKRGYYESTWGAINRALRAVGVVEHEYMKAAADAIESARRGALGA